jgi:DNA-binding CsgD family transcriptional regulator
MSALRQLDIQRARVREIYHAGSIRRQLGAVAWRRVCTALEAIEPEKTVRGMFARSLEQIAALVPFDHALSVLSDAENIGQVKMALTFHAPDTILDSYFRHYASLDPAMPIIPSLSMVGTMDWAEVGDSEFTRDFIYKSGSRFVLGVNGFRRNASTGFFIGLYRARAAFSEQELSLMTALSSHLSNMFSGLIAPLETLHQRLAAAVSGSGLTGREREIALLLSSRLAVAEIAERLFISPRTVAKHLQSIYLKLKVEGKKGLVDRLLGAEALTTGHGGDDQLAQIAFGE